jgi:hypothetical protein
MSKREAAMEDEIIDSLSDAMREYFGDYELEELCHRFGLELERSGIHPDRKKLVTQLVQQKYRDTHQRFLETVLPKLLKRCEERILNTTWEMNVFDEHMLPQLKKLQNLVGSHSGTDLRDTSANLSFTSRTKLAQFMQTSQTNIAIVDTHADSGTLECLQGVKKPIRLLVGQSEKDIIDDIGDDLAQFRRQGHEIEVRRHLKLNDRFHIFNGRCWMASCSLTDVDPTRLCLIECIDTKAAIIKEIGRKWREGKVFLK